MINVYSWSPRLFMFKSIWLIYAILLPLFLLYVVFKKKKYLHYYWSIVAFVSYVYYMWPFEMLMLLYAIVFLGTLYLILCSRDTLNNKLTKLRKKYIVEKISKHRKLLIGLVGNADFSYILYYSLIVAAGYAIFRMDSWLAASDYDLHMIVSICICYLLYLCYRYFCNLSISRTDASNSLWKMVPEALKAYLTKPDPANNEAPNTTPFTDDKVTKTDTRKSDTEKIGISGSDCLVIPYGKPDSTKSDTEINGISGIEDEQA